MSNQRAADLIEPLRTRSDGDCSSADKPFLGGTMDFEDPEGLEEFEADDDARCEAMAEDQRESIKKLAAQDKCVVYSIQGQECSIHEVDSVYRVISVHDTAAKAHFAIEAEEAAQANGPPSERLHFSVWDRAQNELDELDELRGREDLKINPPF